MTKMYRPLAVFCWLVSVTRVFSLATTPVYHGSSPSDNIAHADTTVTDSVYTVATSRYINSTDNHGNVTHLPDHKSDNHGNVTHPPDHHDNQIDHSYDAHGNDSDHHGNDSAHEEHHDDHGVHLASLQIAYVAEPLVISILLLIVILCKVGFHHAHWLSSKVPESCLLIILGTIIGSIIFFNDFNNVHFSEFTARVFFLFLLPPIILEAAYSLHNRVFFDNLGTILLYAVLGTILNWIIIGPILYGLAICGAMGTISITMVQCLVFAALIVAVDPVAVLAIFQELGVNNVLYFTVFGESLLNDAVTVVLYNAVNAFTTMNSVPIGQIFMALGAFFTVSLGGLAIGMVVGAITGFVTKFTREVRVVEPLVLFTLAYTSYLLAELFHFSGIISITGCGLVQAQYAFPNISRKSHTTVLYFMKMFSMACDFIIFIFLGLSLVSDKHVWQTGFILWSVFLCLVIRFSVTYFLTFFANLCRLRQINKEEQFIMAYGGLRGAVAFALVTVLDQDAVPNKRLFQTTTLAIIICTVFIQGISIKPLVRLLRITSQNTKKPTFCEEINSRMTEHIMSGIEEICGRYGDNRVRNKLYEFDNRFLKKWLMREPKTNDETIMDLFGKETLQMHIENVTEPSDWVAYAEEQDTIDPDIIEFEGEHKGVTDLKLAARLRKISESGSYARKISTINGPFLNGIRTPRISRVESPFINRKISTVSREFAIIQNGYSSPRRKISAISQYNNPSPAENFSRRSSARWSRRSQKNKQEGVVEEPTVDNVRDWLVKVPTSEMRYDRDLVSEKNHDLIHHLLQKELRTQRKRISMGQMGPRAPSEPNSCVASPIHSTHGSMENIARAAATLDVIKEDNPGRLTRKRSLSK